jgi:uncharacterized protein (TIGR00255 family)
MAIVSMTGFGRAEGASGGYAWAWEARSVNGRGLDVRSRLPNGFDALEPVVREAAQKRFKRGSLQIGLVLKRDASAPAVTVNAELVDALLAASEPFVAAGRVAAPTWDGLLNVRGVLASEETSETPETRAALEEALKIGLSAALDGLATTRAQEGAATAKVLEAALAQIESSVTAARALAAATPAALLERIRSRLDALSPEVAIDPQRLAQEATMAAQRADVREELDRLSAHVEEARALLVSPDAAGRRLEFLAQEFNREANTLGSKSSDLALTRISLDLKTTIDQLREQAANVE